MMKYHRILSTATAAFVNWNTRTCSRSLCSSSSSSRATIDHSSQSQLLNERRCLSTETKLYFSEKNIDGESTTTASSSTIQRLPSTVFLELSDDDKFSQIGQDIATLHSIPILSTQSADDNGLSSYTHCIHILPYEYNTLQTYAIAIQPIAIVNSSQQQSSKQQRANGKRKNSKVPQISPVYIDFCPPLQSTLGKRLGQSQGGEMLLKAVAPGKYGNRNSNDDDDSGHSGKSSGAIVYDLTAGFGQDSMILAAGKTAQVHMVERDPIVGLLLNDAVRRLNLIAEMDQHDGDARAQLLVDKVRLHQDDAVGFCRKRISELNAGDGHGESSEQEQAPDVCYLDPMFPPRTKSAAVKKNMQILHGLFHTNEKTLGDDERWAEEQDLLNEALTLAKSRVVVKRPVNAPPLGTSSVEAGRSTIRLPSFDLRGSGNRFDVYIIS